MALTMPSDDEENMQSAYLEARSKTVRCITRQAGTPAFVDRTLFAAQGKARPAEALDAGKQEGFKGTKNRLWPMSRCAVSAGPMVGRVPLHGERVETRFRLEDARFFDAAGAPLRP